MLRSKPTRVALTEDDLCYHIDSIFSRNDQLTNLHRQRTGSDNSYDGDDDEDGLFLDSDAFSQSETLFESECDETQQRMTAEESPQEALDQIHTRASVSSLRRGPVSVRFASTESSPLSPGADSDPQLSQVIVRNRRPALDDPGMCSIQSVSDPHSLPLPLQLALLSSTDWNRVRGGFTSQYNDREPRVPSPRLSRPVEVVLDANIASLLSSITALPVRIFGRQSDVGLFGSGTMIPQPQSIDCTNTTLSPREPPQNSPVSQQAVP